MSADNKYTEELTKLFIAQNLSTPGDYPELSEDIDRGSSKFLLEYKNENFPFNPYHVGPLFQSVGESLSNLSVIRERAYSIASESSLAIHDLSLRDSTNGYQRKLSKILRDVDLNSVSRASELKEDANKTSPSNSSHASTQSVISDADSLQGGIYEALDFHFAQLKNKLMSDNSSQNYVQRYCDLRDEFILELVECYRKARCLGEGMQNIYGSNISLPELDDEINKSYLNALEFWFKKIEFDLEKYSSRTSEFNWYFQGYNYQRDYLKGFSKPLYESHVEFKSDRSNGTFEFEVTREMLENNDYENLVLRGVNFQIIPSSPATNFKDKTKFYNWCHHAAKLQLPDQALSVGNEKFIPEPIYIEVKPYRRDNPASFLGQNECRNLDPFGKWSIEVSPTSLVGATLSDNSMPNIALELRLAGWNN